MGIVGKDNKYGAVNSKGELIIPLKYTSLNFFIDDVASAGYGEGIGIINNRDKVLVDFKYDDIDYFFDGLAVAQKNNKFGYIDIQGEEVIPFKYDYATPFCEGLAAVEQIVDKNGYLTVINKDGEAMLEMKGLFNVSSFSDGIALVTHDNRLKGFIMNNHKIRRDNSYNQLKRRSEKYKLYSDYY
jgi:hypothetical protein